MRILIKLPSRSRPEKLLAIASKYVEYAEDMNNIRFLISLDNDDKTATPELIQCLKNIHRNIEVYSGISESKIHAINRDIPHFSTWDILLLASDDMNPVQKGYDNIIRNKMKQHYPDTDGVLFFNDGYNGKKLNTLVICGSKYYQRFGYVYYSGYKSFFCDDEFTKEAWKLNKQTYYDKIIIRHEHPNVLNQPYDELYTKNQIFYNTDKDLFNYRNKPNPSEAKITSKVNLKAIKLPTVKHKFKSLF
jgi:hypothetical protein